MYKIRTIDVWDTLLRRDCHPECIKLATAHHLLFGWRDRIKPEFCDGWLLYKLRLEAELALAEQAQVGGKDDEYEITRVLKHWTSSIFADSVPLELPEQLAEFELNVEISRSYVDPQVIEFIGLYEAENTMFLSDFYMGAQMIERLLSAKNLNILIPEGLTSCDVGLNKRSGNIFKYLHHAKNINPEQHLHIGDNFWSDVESPRKLGVTSVHYLPENEHALRKTRQELFLSRDTLFRYIHKACLKETEFPLSELTEQQKNTFMFGIEVAPIFIGFSLWVAEQGIINNHDKIFFLSREGEFFYEVYRTVIDQQSLFGHRLPIADVLEVSRQSTFLASIKNISIDEMTRLWRVTKSQNIYGLFKTLRLDINDFSSLLKKLKLNHDDDIKNPEKNLAIIELFKNEDFLNAVHISIKDQKDKLEKYLGQKEIEQDKHIGLVDIGWRGSIQDNLAKLMSKTDFYGMYLGLRSFLNHQSPNVKKTSFGPNENLSPEFIELFENFAVMEWLSSSSLGTVTNYHDQFGFVEACRLIDKDEMKSNQEYVKHFQEGVLHAASRWRPYIESYVLSSSEIRGLAMEIWKNFCFEPNPDLADFFMRTPQQDIFCYGGSFDKNSAPSLKEIFESLYSKSKRNQLIEFIRRLQWSAGINSLENLTWINRRVLYFLFRIANGIKYTRIRLYWYFKK